MKARAMPAFAPRPPSAPPSAPASLPFVPPELPKEAYAAYQEDFAALAADDLAPIPHALPVHPEANRYKMLTVRRLQGLSRNIAAQGQRLPIILIDGAVLDGRNRLAACLLSGTRPLFRPYEGEGGSPKAFVESLNEERRHMSPAELAALAVEELPRHAAEAKERMAKGRLEGGDGASPPGKRDESGRALVQAAQSVGAGIQGTKVMLAAKKVEPRIVELAAQDLVTIEQARALKDLPKNERDQAVERIQAGEKASKVLLRQGEPLVLMPDPPAEPVVVEEPAVLRAVYLAWRKFEDVEKGLDAVLAELEGPAHVRTRGPAAKLLREVRAEMAALRKRLDAAPYLQRPCPACRATQGVWCLRRSGGYGALHKERLEDAP